jgi:glycosyltransferase involved in cell wall biosynthesis
VAVEAINCHQHTARRILTDAYRRLGWEPYQQISDQGIEQENDLYRCATWVFAPSPLVAESLIEQSVPEKKIVRTSYGWSPTRFAGEHVEKRSDVFTALFVGSICVRKGPHLLAAAWRDAGMAGRLLFAGRVEGEFSGDRMALVSAPGAEILGHTDRVPALMREAHVLMFPTLEEGSPLVIYEAAAMGMAIVTTPMGAGEVIRDGREGIVLDPYDHDAWVQAIRRLAGDPDLRARLGAAAKVRAQEFTWDKVARRRLELWRDRL